MLAFITVVIVLAVGYAFFTQGLLTAFTMLVNVLISGVVAFSFFEPLAFQLDDMLNGSFAHGYEDWACLIVLFCVTLTALRVLTNSIAASEPELYPIVQQGGALVCGMLTGYLIVGFIVCAMQTLPIPEDFLGFSSRVDPAGGVRRFLPPDRVWLAIMRRASLVALSSDDEGFDPRGYFELGYQRHRRYGINRDPMKYSGEEVPLNHGDLSSQ
jgi:uncharacterized membrane protein required for colicin V production